MEIWQKIPAKSRWFQWQACARTQAQTVKPSWGIRTRGQAQPAQDSPQGWAFQTDSSQCHWVLWNFRSLREGGVGWKLNIDHTSRRTKTRVFRSRSSHCDVNGMLSRFNISGADKTMSADWIIRVFWLIPSLSHFVEGCWKRRRRWVQNPKNSSELQCIFSSSCHLGEQRHDFRFSSWLCPLHQSEQHFLNPFDKDGCV